MVELDPPARRSFARLGVIAAVDACMTIIQRIEPRDGITLDQVADDVEELCRYRHGDRYVQQAMLEASDRLIADGVAGVEPRPGFGWVRMDDAALMRSARQHANKAAVQLGKTGRAATAANPEALDWEDRQRRDRLIHADQRGREIRAANARNRLRSAPPVKET